MEENVREDQLKVIKDNHLIAHLIIFQNCHTMTQAFKDLEAEGDEADADAGIGRRVKPISDAPRQSFRHV